MGLLNLLGRIGMDTSGLEVGFGRAEKAVDRFQNKLTRQVGGAVLGAFTAQRLVGFGREVIEQGVNIDRLSKKFNLTTTEVQLLQQESKRTGVTFEDLVKNADQLEATLSRLSGGDVIFGADTVEMLTKSNEVIQEFKNQAGVRVAELLGLGKEGGGGTVVQQMNREAFQAKDAARKRQAAIDEVQAREAAEIATRAHVASMDRAVALEKELAEVVNRNRLAQMPKEEQLNELLKERERLMHDERLINGELGPEQKAAAQLAVARNQEKILQLQSSLQSGRQNGLSILSDSLRSVGRFGGETTGPTVRHLSKMERHLYNIERNTGNNGSDGNSFPL